MQFKQRWVWMSLGIASIWSFSAFVLSHCCWWDHTPEIRKVAEPVYNKVKAHYQQYQQFPDLDMHFQFLRASGCPDVKRWDEDRLGGPFRLPGKDIKLFSQTHYFECDEFRGRIVYTYQGEGDARVPYLHNLPYQLWFTSRRNGSDCRVLWDKDDIGFSPLECGHGCVAIKQ